MKDKVRHYGFWYKMLSNFLVICIFFPAFMNFMIMREVAKLNETQLPTSLNSKLANRALNQSELYNDFTLDDEEHTNATTDDKEAI